MVNTTKLYNEAYVTGCDNTQEWMLPWFLENFKKHNNKPLIFANFGVTELSLKIVKENVHAVMDLTKTTEKGWFKKPLSMLKSPSKKTVWIDTDCEVRQNTDDIFNLIEPEKLLMARDEPWTWRRGHLWHNSGVVGFIDKPVILYQWVKAIKEEPTEGDQEVLDKLLSPITKIKYIKDLPNEYNVLRIQLEKDGYGGNVRIAHWTGHKGKIKIASMI
tara:strand:+ start:7994 stop:8644 length:651 start_codon:yes stop_codon:yes gene_type:complete